jgi:AAA domain
MVGDGMVSQGGSMIVKPNAAVKIRRPDFKETFQAFKTLVHCWSHAGWGEHGMELMGTALDSVLKEVKSVRDLTHLLDFLAVSTCMSRYSTTELRDWLLAWHDATSPSSDDGEFLEALKVFVDLHGTLQDSVDERKYTPFLSYLRLVALKDKPGIYSVDRKQFQAKTPPRKGDVFLFEAITPPASNAPNYRWPSFPGIVEEVQQLAILFNFEVAGLPPLEMEQADWQAKAIGNITTSRAMLDALCRQQLSAGAVEGSDDSLLVSASLNESQRLAVTTALKERVSLLWGPPGTGKSFTTVQLLRELLARGERILVTASTHQAVDNILRIWADNYASELLQGSVLRWGELDQVDSACQQWTIDFHPLMKNNTSYQKFNDARKLVKGARVIFSTATGAGLGCLKKGAFDTVLVDEAGQLTSANTRVATSRAQKRVVLIGDHQQLRAMTHGKAQDLGFHKSMFERLREKDYPCVMLDVQYRMHPSLVKYSSDKFYNGKIKSSESTLGITVLDSRPWNSMSHVGWVDVDQGREQRDGTSYSNLEEAELILKFIHELTFSKECSPEEIGVITGYSAQKRCIQRLLGRTCKGVAVRTVDDFQGQERRVIFFSAVRTEKNVGFLKDYHRMNVMFTRSMQGLVVVGRRATLELDPLWKDWIQKHEQFVP